MMLTFEVLLLFLRHSVISYSIMVGVVILHVMFVPELGIANVIHNSNVHLSWAY